MRDCLYVKEVCVRVRTRVDGRACTVRAFCAMQHHATLFVVGIAVGKHEWIGGGMLHSHMTPGDHARLRTAACRKVRDLVAAARYRTNRTCTITWR